MWERKEVIEELRKFFKIQELVRPEIYKKFGELSWRYLPTEGLANLLAARRDIIKVPFIINNWASGGKFIDSGLRCNLSQQMIDKTNANELYISAHYLGLAFDIRFPASSGMTAARARAEIKAKAHLLPYPCRIEKDKSWLHLDSYDNGTGIKVTEFNG